MLLPEEWEGWLQNVCSENNWTHSKSPIVWRELVERGGKGLYVGGFNEFMEYAEVSIIFYLCKYAFFTA